MSFVFAAPEALAAAAADMAGIGSTLNAANVVAAVPPPESWPQPRTRSRLRSPRCFPRMLRGISSSAGR
ncbi:PE-PGRS family protein [Mycobacterium tuberculosis]|nr:PE-PGRS family protein [Mycobacterium tuberculosis]